MKLTQDQIYTVESDQGRTYAVDLGDREVYLPSVTTIINFVVNKPALPPWAYNVGTLELIQSRVHYSGLTDESFRKYVSDLNEGEVKLALIEREASHKHEMERGSKRGIEVHDVLEAISKGNDWTIAKEYKPYTEQLQKWISDYEPEWHEAEYKVASLDHGFAGQFDGICTIHKHPPRRRHESLVGKRVLLDIKTNSSGAVYPESHLPQVEAYREAYQEMGGEQVDHCLVVGIGPDKYSPCFSYSRFKTFKCILDLYNEMQWQKSNNPNKRKPKE